MKAVVARHRSMRGVIGACLLAVAACGTRQHRADTPAASGGEPRGTRAEMSLPDGCAAQKNPLDRAVYDNAAFRWDTVAERRGGDGAMFELRLVSQRWQGIEWEHELLVFVPADAPHPDVALLVLRDGPPGDADRDALRTISRETGTSSAVLFRVPNQPLFDGREEDPLLAHTYSQYLRTGDESWPLLFPMVTSVVRAMDAIQALSAGGRPIDRYVVAGHSKRGHTAWLSGAADPRVRGIIPVAIDVLNSPAQIAHHRAVAGKIGGASGIFEEIIRAADSPRGRCLISMIDPYSYRDRLAEPKLIVQGTHDDYTPADALNLYWDDLPGPKSVLYLPNTGHAGAFYHTGVNPTAFAFVRAVVAGRPMPTLESELRVGSSLAELRVTTDAAVRAARLWTTTSPGRDFRASSWSPFAMREIAGSAAPGSRIFSGEVAVPATGHAAVFGELEFDSEHGPFKLSTRIHVVEGG